MKHEEWWETEEYKDQSDTGFGGWHGPDVEKIVKEASRRARLKAYREILREFAIEGAPWSTIPDVIEAEIGRLAKSKKK